MIVEINGIKYQSVDEPQRPKLSKWAMAALMMGGIYGLGSQGHLVGGNNNPVANVYYVKEYELIKNKQSKLSKANRDYIVRYFEEHFKPIEP